MITRSVQWRLRQRTLFWGLAICSFIALGTAIWWLLAQDGGRGRQWLGDPVRSAQINQRTLPTPTPQLFMPISAREAVEENEKLPFSTEPIEPAPALILPIAQMVASGPGSIVDCLTAAIYYEAANETEQGRRAVAQVVLNRVRHPAFPNTVCGVVYEGSERASGCQFTFTCDGSLRRRPSQAGWESARKLAIGALSGAVEPEVGMATHYHADFVVPYWASSLDKITKLGRHIFYRWKGSWGRRRAFSQIVRLDATEDMKDLLGDLSELNYDDSVFVGGIADLTVAPPPSPIIADDLTATAAADKTVQSVQSGKAGSPLADEKRSALVVDAKAGKLLVK